MTKEVLFPGVCHILVQGATEGRNVLPGGNLLAVDVGLPFDAMNMFLLPLVNIEGALAYDRADYS